jgi:hypothetical protein
LIDLWENVEINEPFSPVGDYLRDDPAESFVADGRAGFACKEKAFRGK